MVSEELLNCYRTARHDLLALRGPEGYWTGQLCSSPLATAAAAGALWTVAEHEEPSRAAAYRDVALRAVGWLAGCQNADGGWGDSQHGPSSLAATMLTQAVFHRTGATAQHAERMGRTEQFIRAEGGAAALKQRYATDRPLAASILTACAAAELLPWRNVPALRFEVVCLPKRWQRRFGGPMVRLTAPGLVAAGFDRFFHRRPHNPLAWLMRRLAVHPSAAALARLQSASGGFFDAVPLTALVVQGFAAGGCDGHIVARGGVRFLLDTVAPDGSWSIARNEVVWNTSRAIGALAAATGDVGALGCLDWLLAAQHQRADTDAGTPGGGWSRNETSGAPADTESTAAALLAVLTLSSSGTSGHRERIEQAGAAGIDWLLRMQNADGGWPTFHRGPGRSPWDRSAVETSAHALRALSAWQNWFPERAVGKALAAGVEFLTRTQRGDGSWLPEWVVNPHGEGGPSALYGTASVLLALRDLGLITSQAARHGLAWLATHAGFDDPAVASPASPVAAAALGVEESALALEALLAGRADHKLQSSISAGAQWLTAAVRAGRHCEATAWRRSFSSLCYDERTNPLIATVAALGQALRE
jgi:squalene-hopene/tetraprenyl-beta-curcumene cyclase